jgi:hypothetical protein
MPISSDRLKSQPLVRRGAPERVSRTSMDVFAPVRDENAAPAELRGGKSFGAAARAFGTPAAKQAGGDAARRAFGDLSNRGGAGPLTGPGKVAAATPRRALGDITNGAPAVATALAKAAAAGPAACGLLPDACSARTASFLTEEMVAQAEVWAAEATTVEALAGPSGAQQQAEERRLDDARLQARLAGLFAPDAMHAADDDTVRPAASA